MPLEKQSKEKIKIIDIKPSRHKKKEEESFMKETPKKTKKKPEKEEIKINILKEKPEEIKEEKHLPQEEFKKETVEEKFFFKPKEEIFETKRLIKLSSKKPLIFSILGLLIFGFIFYYLSFIVLARAEINIITKKIEVPFSLKVVFDSNASLINYEKGIIPANLLNFHESISEDFKSTGKGKDEKKAIGVVTLFNNYSTAPQILVATTRLETPDGKIFRIDSRTVIPGATTQDGKLVPSSIDVNVTADKPGPDYNIPPCDLPDCKFKIVGFKGTPKYEGFYGVSKKPMSGGSLGAVPMILAEDLSQAEEIILKKLTEKLNNSIESKFPQGLKYLEESKSGLKITNLKSDGKAGDFREHFTVSAEGEIKIIGFKEEDVISFIKKELEEEKEENYEFYKNPNFSYKFLKADFNQGLLELNLEGKQLLRYTLNSSEIKDKVLGKNQKEILETLKNTEGISEISIKLKPYWLSKIPKNPSKIKISID